MTLYLIYLTVEIVTFQTWKPLCRINECDLHTISAQLCKWKPPFCLRTTEDGSWLSILIYFHLNMHSMPPDQDDLSGEFSVLQGNSAGKCEGIKYVSWSSKESGSYCLICVIIWNFRTDHILGHIYAETDKILTVTQTRLYMTFLNVIFMCGPCDTHLSTTLRLISFCADLPLGLKPGIISFFLYFFNILFIFLFSSKCSVWSTFPSSRWQ